MEVSDPSKTLGQSTTPITLQPIIQDLVRTRFAVPGSIFLVEHVQITPLTETGRWQVIRLLLGDGDLCIQAILGDAMHRFVHSQEIAVGSYVCVQDSQLRLRNTGSGEDDVKQMVYLVVLDLKTIGWNDKVRRMHAQQRDHAVDKRDPEFVDKGKSPIRPLASTPEASTPSTPTKPASLRSSQRRRDKEDFEEDDMEDAFEEFEALTFPVKKTQAQQPRQSPSKPTGHKTSTKPSLPIALPKDWHDLQTPLKLTTLRAIPNLPYRQNWTCNVLAIIAHLSPVESSTLPPYQQRTARITDPSTAKQVHLTVFLDPAEFAPKVGSAVLLTGVKNHRFDGGSLKKYASDRGLGKWWFEDPWDLAWCDVRGIKDWWAEMEAYFASQMSEEVIGEES
ncbi:cyclin-like F-box [Pochonia chlamydosporia 170]|uniref:Cyclin-like F-box n=1 Tax=Pochonia chlamydosporia 170 TaxID=1380566 RepID=A0A179FX24_METCM|nr:cyclin-like F-box [Pochonia chlamydosporia 170]OAQ69661.1 cyclin-like F-box [Pochonia chlamydosporia 170]